MTIVNRSGELLARKINRRGFLARAATVTFAAAAGFSATFPRMPSALAAQGDCATTTTDTGCGPPNNFFCSSYNASYCNGALCAGGCQYDDQDWATACWCTTTVCIDCHTPEPVCYHYKCCDCKNCPGIIKPCGCSEYIEDCRGCIRAPTNNIHNIPDCIPCC